MGTALVTSKDAPALGGVYKLVEVYEQEDGGTRKLPRFTAKFSADKFTYPGSKQIFRSSGASGLYRYDVLGCAGVPTMAPSRSWKG